MARKFVADILSLSSIEDLKKEIIKYSDDLTVKCERIVNELTSLGYKVAQSQINKSPYGQYISLSIQIDNLKSSVNAMLIATGEVKTSDKYPDFSILLAVEFGAGQYYNKTINPNANKLGYGPGTFPGQTHAMEDGWYYWDENKQLWVYTHGTKATMPMYEAYRVVFRDVDKVAKGVFA